MLINSDAADVVGSEAEAVTEFLSDNLKNSHGAFNDFRTDSVALK